MQLKEKKAKRKVNKVNVAAIIMSIIALLGLVCFICGIGVIVYLLKDKPKLDLNDFNAQESSIVYDKDDNQIYELGTVIRQNISYEELPSSLIDAFVAVEDSRFFEHGGFDVPRFAKAFLSNLKTMSFSQGGSTFTMQLVKNTYFVDDEAGSGAAKSIKRKVQEIALALELENKSTKKEIFTNYLNKLNFGGTNQNIRGVQKAAQYYFGKDVQELTLPESAMLAGVINSPYLFNPYNYLEYAQDRRDEVLYLMNYHGYISDDEYYSALGTRVEDFLQGSKQNARGSGNGTAYQAFIDYVVEEVFDLTGLDPYTTPMRIHTSMDSDIQDLIDNIEAGEVDDYFSYPDDEFEVASICVNNDTGEILGILGGRNYSDGGALLLNHATDQYKQPGSSIKPILDYVQAFEVLGWSTSHCIVDKPLAYVGTDYIISNATNSYAGEISLKYAVGMSLNTPAIQTIRKLIDAKGNSYLVDYLTSMGYDINLNDFDEQYGIGGKGLNVSCLQMAGAYAALMNGGYYTKPHTIRKIEFLNEKAPITPTYSKNQTVSEQSCFLMSEILRNDVEGGYPNLMGLFRDDNYKVYAKTGTTNWGTEGKQYNIPNGSIKDGWVVACTSEYSIATWMGYEKGQLGKPSYMNYDVYNRNIKGKISKLILDKLAEKYGYPEDIKKPSGITTITHIAKEGTPYVAPIEGMDEEYLTTGYIKSSSKLVNLASPQSATIESMPSKPTVSLDSTTLKIKWPDYPNSDMLHVADEDMDLSLKKSDGSTLLSYKGNRMFDYTWVFGAVKYKADITVYTDNKVVGNETVTSSEPSASVDLRKYLASGSSVKACAYYGYDKKNIDSASECVNIETPKDLFDKTFEIPVDVSYNDVAKMFEIYTSNIVHDYVETTDKELIGNVYQVIINAGKSQTVLSGGSATVDTSKISQVTIVTYTNTNYTVTIGYTDTDDYCTLTATVSPSSYDGDFVWKIDGKEVEADSVNKNTSTLKVERKDSDQNVTVIIDNNSEDSRKVDKKSSS